jgi:hypothetical protein
MVCKEVDTANKYFCVFRLRLHDHVEKSTMLGSLHSSHLPSSEIHMQIDPANDLERHATSPIRP